MFDKDMSVEEITQHLEASRAFDSEEFGFAQELAMHFGFVFTDDDATQMACSNKQLYVLMKALGYERIAREIPAPSRV